MPTTCTNEGFTSCPQGYSCQQQPETNNYYCCTSLDDRLNDGCPPSQFAYFVGDEVKTCDPFNSFDSICPLHYTCQWSLKNQKYQCCGTRLIKRTKSKIDDGCLNKQFALINLKSGKPRVCTPGEVN
uniref:CC domain-containing protein n=1 Tax=Heterorhabditis bacteriophora TaxID=37862 RepID=A0A1I7XDK2_HETBA